MKRFRNILQAYQCLLNTNTNSALNINALSEFSNGQLWDPDYQCKLAWGENATFCRVICISNTKLIYKKILYSQFTQGDMCYSFNCRKNETAGCVSYVSVGAEDGTVCASGSVRFCFASAI